MPLQTIFIVEDSQYVGVLPCQMVPTKCATRNDNKRPPKTKRSAIFPLEIIAATHLSRGHNECFSQKKKDTAAQLQSPQRSILHSPHSLSYRMHILIKLNRELACQSTNVSHSDIRSIVAVGFPVRFYFSKHFGILDRFTNR